jgi:small ligand-binding sensory domain FIST
LSGHLDTRTAATEIAHELAESIGSTCDLALMLGSYHHRAAFADAAATIRQTIGPRVLLGTTAESVLGASAAPLGVQDAASMPLGRELEGLAGMTVLALKLPGVKLHPFSHVHTSPESKLDDPESVRRMIGFNDDLRAVLLLADPFSTPSPKLLDAIATCAPGRSVPIFGGLASGASQPGQNVMVINEHTRPFGAVGVSISGRVRIDHVVSQGCRSIGKPLIVTKCNNNVIIELGGRKPMQALQELAEGLSNDERELLSKGIFIGLVINEYKPRFGRGDFLIRNIMGMDKKTGAIAVGDMLRVGQTIQFHVRDEGTADEDLQLLLDAQVMDEKPLAAMVFTCNGRGTKLFSQPNHDVQAIQERLGPIPLAGFFCAGEIGPIGERSFLHGHTVSAAIFRAINK